MPTKLSFVAWKGASCVASSSLGKKSPVSSWNERTNRGTSQCIAFCGSRRETPNLALFSRIFHGDYIFPVFEKRLFVQPSRRFRPGPGSFVAPRHQGEANVFSDSVTSKNIPLIDIFDRLSVIPGIFLEVVPIPPGLANSTRNASQIIGGDD